MRAALVPLVVLALAGAAGAANPKDPQRHFTAADTRIANAVNVRLSDFVTGWKDKQGDSSSDDCAAQPDESKLVETADVAREFDFGSNGNVSVQSEVQLFATAAQAKADWATYRLPRLRSCMTEIFVRAFGKGWQIHSTIAAVPAHGPHAERALHYRLRVLGSYRTKKVDLASDLIVLGKGRVTATLSTFAPSGTFDRASLDTLAARLAQRLANA